jgi:membrane protease YdiL (CAAX protease family)
LLAAYLLLQDTFLPLPKKMEEAYQEFLGREKLSAITQLFLLAISPGICEELLWRGAVQGELEARGKPVKTVLTVGIFFGLFHLSIYRLIPTGLLGVLLALVRHRSGSIFPCILLHIAYNALLLFFLKPLYMSKDLAGIFTHPLSLGLAAVVLVGCLLGLRSPRRSQAGATQS